MDRHRRGGVEPPHQHRLRALLPPRTACPATSSFRWPAVPAATSGSAPQRTESAAPGNRVQKRFTSADGLPDDFIRSLYTDRDGSLWIGTRHGLAHLAGGKFTSYSSMDGLGSDFIGAILAQRVPCSGWAPRRAEPGCRTRLLPTTPCSKGSPTTPSRPSPRTPKGRFGWAPTAAASTACATWQRSQSISLGFPRVAGHHLRHARRRRGHLWLSSKTGIFRVSIAAAERLLLRSSPCDRGDRLWHGGRHEHPRVQRRGPSGGLEAGRRKPVVRHPGRGQFHRSRAHAGKPRAPSGGD